MWLFNFRAEFFLPVFDFEIGFMSHLTQNKLFRRHSLSRSLGLVLVMLNGNRLTGYQFTSLETGSQSEKPVIRKLLSFY